MARGPLPESAFDLDEILAGLEQWVGVSSPTFDRDGVNRMMDLAQAAMVDIGAACERHSGREGRGDAVTARFPGDQDGPGIMVLCHLDTVHASGSFAYELSFRHEGDLAYGPGILDMKGGTFLAVQALRAVLAADGATPLRVSVLFIPDEEIGSPTTRDLIEAEARRNRYVLVPEPAQEGANLITGRWAFQRFTVCARGRPAHAGATLSSGRSAIREIAEQIVAIEGMSEPDRQITLSAGTVHGGTFVNVVPTSCEAEVLIVTARQEDFDRIRAQVTELAPRNEGIELEVDPGPVRPLFTPSDGGLELYDRARDLARSIGFDPGHDTVGGGSDGNFTGALGIPTLDGLGPEGGDFHTENEHVYVPSLIPRARLLSGLFRSLA